MLMGTQYQRGINGVGSLRPTYGMSSVGDLPGFQDPTTANPNNPSDPATVIANIGEGIWQVIGSLLYIMGAVPEVDMVEYGRAGRIAVEKYFASQVGTADVVAGSADKINAAANATARYFLNLFGGKPRPATGVASGDLAGTCMAYSVGDGTSTYAAQTRIYRTPWSAQTRCNQLKALMTGSGLNFLQVALGGDGLGNMPSSMAPTVVPGVQPSYSAAPSAYSYGGALFNGGGSGGSGPSPAYQAPLAPVVSPVVQVYQPVVSAPPVSASAIATYDPQAAQAPPAIVVSPSTPAARLVVNSDPIANTSNSTTPSSSISPVASSTTGGTNTVYVPYGMPVQSAPVTTPSATDALTSWVSSNPLLAAGVVVGAFMLFGRGK